MRSRTLHRMLMDESVPPPPAQVPWWWWCQRREWCEHGGTTGPAPPCTEHQLSRHPKRRTSSSPLNLSSCNRSSAPFCLSSSSPMYYSSQFDEAVLCIQFEQSVIVSGACGRPRRIWNVVGPGLRRWRSDFHKYMCYIAPSGTVMTDVKMICCSISFFCAGLVRWCCCSSVWKVKKLLIIEDVTRFTIRCACTANLAGFTEEISASKTIRLPVLKGIDQMNVKRSGHWKNIRRSSYVCIVDEAILQ